MEFQNQQMKLLDWNFNKKGVKYVTANKKIKMSKVQLNLSNCETLKMTCLFNKNNIFL